MSTMRGTETINTMEEVHKGEYMLKDVSIGLRLGLGLGLVLLLMFLIGGFSINRLATLNRDTSVIVNDRWPKAEMAADIKDNINIVARSLRNMLLLHNKDDIQKESQRISKARDVVSKNLEALDKMIQSAEGKVLLKRITDARATYTEIQNDIIEKIGSGEKEVAVSALIMKLRPIQSAYFDAVDALIQYQGMLMKQAVHDAAVSYKNSRNLVISALLVGLCLTLVVTLSITSSIIRPLNDAIAAANKIADGDLSEDIEVDRKDEVGQLLAAMKIMVGNLRNMTGKINLSLRPHTLTSGSKDFSISEELD